MLCAVATALPVSIIKLDTITCSSSTRFLHRASRSAIAAISCQIKLVIEVSGYISEVSHAQENNMKDTIEINNEPWDNSRYWRERCGVCWTTIDRWRRRGLLPDGSKIGRVWYWRRAAV